MKKILVLDIDGTCIKDTYNVTEELRQVIHLSKKYTWFILPQDVQHLTRIGSIKHLIWKMI